MKKLLIFLIFISSTTNNFAWGGKGHEMVAQVAFSHLDENTKKNVLPYLGGMTIEEASTWMDEIKGDKSLDYMKPYHYVNFKKGFKVADQEGSNIVYILNKTIKELGNKNKLNKGRNKD